jgi:Mg2+-importing ATPase
MAIATDRVDAEAVQRPRHWDVKFIRDFMIRFGVLSSVFDFVTFGVLFFMLHASPELFRSGWFVESVVSASVVVLVLRTRGPFWHSRASAELTLATMTIVAAAVALPFTPLGRVFGFVPLPPVFLALMGLIVAAYIVCAEVLKGAFYRKNSPRPPSAQTTVPR